LSVLLAEISLRFFFPPEVVFIQGHPKLGWFNILGKTGTWVRETVAAVHVEINSKGLRDLERSHERPARVVRIMMLGDSFINAFNVSFERLASRQLEKILRTQLGTDRIEVVNAGCQGWGTAQELIFLRTEGFKYQPDIVVLNVFMGNDFANNYAKTAAPTKPAYTLEDGALRLRAPVHNKTVAYVRDKILARSALVRTARRSRIFGLLNVSGRAGRMGLVSSDQACPATDENARNMSAIAKLLFHEMDDAVRSQGASLFVHIIPHGADLLDHVPAESLSERTYDGRPDGRKELLTRLCEESISSLDELNIRYIFAWNRLVADAKRGVQPYVGFGGHWTVDGNRGAAQDIAHVIMGTVKYR
jgi:hypothetical protein